MKESWVVKRDFLSFFLCFLVVTQTTTYQQTSKFLGFLLQVTPVERYFPATIWIRLKHRTMNNINTNTLLIQCNINTWNKYNASNLIQTRLSNNKKTRLLCGYIYFRMFRKLYFFLSISVYLQLQMSFTYFICWYFFRININKR